MKAAAVIVTPALAAQRRKAKQDELNEKRIHSEARKKMMLEKEAAARAKKPQTDEDLMKEATRIAYAEPLTDKETDHDSAKRMNSLNARAEAFLVRKTQIKQKVEGEEGFRHWERQQDARAEYDRRQDIAMMQRAEREKRQRNKTFQKGLLEQIAANQHSRLMDEEQTELDKQAMQERRVAMDKEEVQRQQAMARDKHKRVQAVIRSNENQKVMKEKDEQMMREADLSILRYQQRKVRDEERLEAEKAEKRKQENARNAKLLAQQEKSMDTQAEEDEARANRATEQKERLARQQEEQERMKIHRVNLQMASDKQAAFEAKAIRQTEELREKVYEAEILKVQQYRASCEEVEKDRRKREAALSNRQLVQLQMKAAQDARGGSRQRKEEERRRQKMDFMIEKVKLQRVQKEKRKTATISGMDTSDLDKMVLGHAY